MRQLLNLLRYNARRGEFRAEGNTLYIYDVIVATDVDAEWFGGVSAETVVKQIAAMTGPITLRINSPGGDVFAARAIQAAMDRHDGDITAYVDGYAASAASVIAVAADRTVMAAGSFMMIHKAWTIGIGNADDFLSTAALLEKVDGTIADTYAAKSGKDPAGYAGLMASETWFTAAEAVEDGLADEVAGEAPKAAIAWSLDAYEHAPAAKREEPDDPAPLVADETARRQRIAAVRMRINH